MAVLLEDALSRHQKNAEIGKGQKLQIIPTRGFGMELSGHVGDACWATKYESMAESFPNMTSLIFKRGEEGSATERLVGSAMLLETTDNEGQPVLLLRGVNPTQNYVNKIKIDEFYNFVTDYTRSIAQSKGMRPAIVVDDHSGAAGTNRPVLHDYEKAQTVGIERIIVDEKTSSFNGYNVTYKSFAL